MAKRSWVISGALSVIAAANACWAQGPPHAPLVVVAPVTQKEISVGQAFVGTVMPSRKATIGSAVDGRVIEFPLNEGDRVAKDQPLAQLLTDTISLEIQAAEAELELRRQALAELENGTRPEELEQARARMSSAEARRNYLQARRERWQQLYDANRAISEEELDEAVSSGIEAEQAYLEAKAANDLAVAGPRKEQIAQARAQVAVQEATVDRLKDQRTKHTIISRFDGYVTAEHTEIGQWVKQGDPVADVVALDEVEVVAYVVEQHVPHVRVGEQVNVEVPAVAGQLFAGTVCEVVPQADVQARTFPVKVRVANQFVEEVPLLKAGMYARVSLPTGEKRSATLVPKDALVLGGPQPMVYVVEGVKAEGETGKVAPISVQMGVAEGRLIQVSGPLQAGQMVVVQGNERLRPGLDVAVQRVVDGTEARGAVSRTDAP
ncbi:MAG: efflux RND transporter periplasmic adaptor subunit [Pirellulales bacterium]